MKVFISYSAKDGLEIANKLHQALHDKGHDAFFFKHDAGAGQNVWDIIAKECLERGRILFVITNSSFESKGQRKEYDFSNSHYLEQFAFIDKNVDHRKLYDEFPYLKNCNNPDFSNATLEKDCEKLSIDFARLRKRSRGTEIEEVEDSFPKLGTATLDESQINEGISLISQTFQNETIIPNICRTRVITKQEEPNLLTLGHSLRLPIEWFKSGQTQYCNDVLFRDIGHEIALAERSVIGKEVFAKTQVPIVKGMFTSEKIVEAIEKAAETGALPDLIFPTIPDFLYFHRGSKDMKLEWNYTQPKSPAIEAVLNVGKYKLGIVSPLGSFPKETFVFNKQTIIWKARSYADNGALFIRLGLDRLYPLKFVELIAVERAKCEISEKGIVKLNLEKEKKMTL